MSNDINALEREIEETRARLADTIDQLVYRTKPKTIIERQVESTKAHFVDLETGEPRTENLIKAAAVVAGVVVVFAIIRKIAK